MRKRYFCAALVIALIGRASVQAAGSGATQQNAGLSCKGILNAGMSGGDGIYWIDPNGGTKSDAFQVYCDMTTDGGGWTLAVNSVTGEEPATNDMTSNTGVAGLDRGHTRNLANLAINNNADIRYVLDDAPRSRFFHARFSGRFHNGLPPFAVWTTMAGHTAGADALLSNQFNRSWSTSLSDRDALSSDSCANLYGGVPWHYGNCWSSMPTNPLDGLTQGPPGPNIVLSRFSIFVREAVTLLEQPTNVAPSFGLTANLPTGTGPADAAIGDFDNDGRPDVVTANSVGNVTVRYANGTAFQLGGLPPLLAVAAGHFTADTRLDFVTVNSSGVVNTFINNGTSFFTPIFFSACATSAIGAADFDKNGTTDLALACPGGPVFIASGNGGGGFAIANSFSTNTNTHSLALADFNGDSRMDMVVTGGSTGCFNVFLGVGGFSFSPNFQCSSSFLGPVAAGDWSGDGRPDLVVGANSAINSLRNANGVSFISQVIFGVNSVVDLALADVDTNGRLDLIVAHNAPAVGVALGDGGGFFALSPPFGYGTSAFPRTVAVGDLNADGRPDIVATDNATDSISIFTNSFGVNAPPVAADGTLTVIEGTTETGILSATDPEGSALTFALTGTGSKGTATLTNAATGAYSYTANPGETGTDTFTFTASDGTLASDPGTITVTITPKLTPQIDWATPAAIVFGTPLGAAQLNATADVDGTFSYSPGAGTILGAGPAQALTVTFTPTDTTHYATAVDSVAIDVLPASTTTGIAASASMIAVLQPLKLTATVGVVAPGAGTPGGTVMFFDGATAIGSAPVSGGVAMLTLNGLAPGAHTFAATYSGDGNFNGSSSGTTSVTVRELSQSTFTFAFSTSNPTALGQRATLSAAVFPLAGSVTPTGTVAFLDGSTVIGTAPLSGGVATFSTTALPVGPHFIFAVYLGNTVFSSSVSSPAVHNVYSGTPPLLAATTVSASAAPTTIGQPVTFTATVTPTSGTPTGTVVFLVDNTLLGTAALTAVGGSIQAQVTTSALPLGTHIISAIYVGNGVFGASASAPFVHKVQ